MLGKSHLLIAGATYAALAARPLATPLGTFALPRPAADSLGDPSLAFGLGILIAAVGGLAPDLDKSGSAISRTFGIVTGLLSWGIEQTLGHRGALHSLLGVVAAYGIGTLAGSALGIAHVGTIFAFGWLVHLLCDSLTASGVPLLFPWARRFRLPPGFTTGGAVEYLVVVLILIGCLLWGLAIDPRPLLT